MRHALKTSRAQPKYQKRQIVGAHVIPARKQEKILKVREWQADEANRHSKPVGRGGKVMDKKNPIVKKEDSAKEWEIYDPFRGFRMFRHPFGSLFEELFNEGKLEKEADLFEKGTLYPAVDVEKGEKQYIFTAELPGMAKDAVHVDVDGNVLKIHGERKEQKEEKGRDFIRRESFAGNFCRMFTLPVDAKGDTVKAAFKNGVLKVTIERNGEVKPKEIPLETE